MKNWVYLLFMFLFCACQNSDDMLIGDSDSDGQTTSVTVNYDLPEAPQSRADGDPTATARTYTYYGNGVKVNRIWYGVYNTSATDKSLFKEGEIVLPENNPTSSLSGRFVIEGLPIGDTFDFVFWAYNDQSGYTINTSDGTVSMNYSAASAANTEGTTYAGATCNDENRDAFFNNKLAQTITRGYDMRVLLYRPFAQLNILTDDMPDNNTAQYKVTLGANGGGNAFYDKLNLRTGHAESTSPTTLSFLPANVSDSTYVINGKSYKTVSMNYILMDGEQSESDPTYIDSGNKYKQLYNVQLYMVKGSESHWLLGSSETGLTGVPFKRNYRTNIYGSLITTSGSCNYEIVTSFNQPDLTGSNTAATYSELTALLNGTQSMETYTITLTGSIDLEAPITIGNGYTGKNVTIDLCGNDICAKMDGINVDKDFNSAPLISLNNKDVTLTIMDSSTDGNGNLGVGRVDYVIGVKQGNLEIKGGNFMGKKGAVIWLNKPENGSYADGTASPKIHIYDGYFSATEKETVNGVEVYRLLDFDLQVPGGVNTTDSSGNSVSGWDKNNVCNFIVYGGKFQSFDPSNCKVNGYATWNFLPRSSTETQSVADNKTDSSYESISLSDLTNRWVVQKKTSSSSN